MPSHNKQNKKNTPLAIIFGVIFGIVTGIHSDAMAAGGGEKKPGKTAFGPGEHVIQLPPMWIPVNKRKSQKRNRYAPVTIFLTSKDGGITNMCYQLPYLSQAFLFALNDMDVRMKGRREVQTEDLGSKLLAVAIKTTDKMTVKKIKVISGTPHPTSENQDMLALCQ